MEPLICRTHGIPSSQKTETLWSVGQVFGLGSIPSFFRWRSPRLSSAWVAKWFWAGEQGTDEGIQLFQKVVHSICEPKIRHVWTYCLLILKSHSWTSYTGSKVSIDIQDPQGSRAPAEHTDTRALACSALPAGVCTSSEDRQMSLGMDWENQLCKTLSEGPFIISICQFSAIFNPMFMLKPNNRQILSNWSAFNAWNLPKNIGVSEIIIPLKETTYSCI